MAHAKRGSGCRRAFNGIKKKTIIETKSNAADLVYKYGPRDRGKFLIGKLKKASRI